MPGAFDLRWIARSDTTITGNAFSVAGKMAFVTDVLSAQVQIFDTETGLKVGTVGPGKEVGYDSGWTDFPMCIRAYQRPDGEYLVFVEEDWCAKVMLYRLKIDVKELFETPF